MDGACPCTGERHWGRVLLLLHPSYLAPGARPVPRVAFSLPGALRGKSKKLADARRSLHNIPVRQGPFATRSGLFQTSDLARVAPTTGRQRPPRTYLYGLRISKHVPMADSAATDG